MHTMFKGKGNRKSRGHHYNKNKVNVDKKDVSENINESPVVIQQFKAYSIELDSKHDRFERIVKLNRDITIESKRIIFLLHTLDNVKRDIVLEEAKQKLNNMKESLFKSIAYELDNQDIYEYLKAYRGGLEEYIEAITFFQYLQNGCLEDWIELEKALTFNVLDKPNSTLQDNVIPFKAIKTSITPNEYMLGIADLTGELMRKCINNLATGDIQSCYHTCNFVRNMYKGFLGCTIITVKEANRKLYTLKQNLAKIENVCYLIKVRGSEIPRHMLADAAIVATEKYPVNNDDEESQI